MYLEVLLLIECEIMDRRGHMKIAKNFSTKVIRVDEEDIKGYVSFMKIHEVHSPIVVDGFCICDDGVLFKVEDVVGRWGRA